MAFITTKIEEHAPKILIGEPKALIPLKRNVNFFSKVFLIPFDIKWDERQRSYQLVKFSFRRKIPSFFCAMGTFFTLFYGTSTIYSSVMTNASIFTKDLTLLFIVSLMLMLMSWISVMQMLWIYWFRANGIERIFNATRSFKVSPVSSPLAWVLPITFYIFGNITILTTPTGAFTVDSGSRYGANLVLTLLRVFACLDNRILFNIFQTIFKVLILAGCQYTPFLHATVVNLGLSLRNIGKEVKEMLSSVQCHDDDYDFSKGLALFDTLSKLVKEVNSVFRGLVFVTYLCNIIFLIQIPLWFTSIGGVHEKFNLIIYMVTCQTVWWSCSEFHRMVHSSMSHWIHKSLHKDVTVEDRLKLITLANSIATRPIALSCSYFTITHSMLATTFGAIMTYGVIVLQLQLKPSSMQFIYTLNMSSSSNSSQ